MSRSDCGSSRLCGVAPIRPFARVEKWRGRVSAEMLSDERVLRLILRYHEMLSALNGQLVHNSNSRPRPECVSPGLDPIVRRYDKIFGGADRHRNVAVIGCQWHKNHGMI